MPSDANGNYSLPAGYLAVTGDTIQPSQHNPPLEDVAASLTARLMRSGAGAMTGPLKLVDGAVGAPGLSFATSPSSGLYKTASGNIGVAIAGVGVVEFGAGGIARGARYVGEIFDFTGSNAPPLCVLCFGQTLSRTVYAELWTLAQAEIAAGNTLYNNGDGATTFGIADLRGRVRASRDNAGGTPAGRLTTSYFGTNAATLGNTGGGESLALTLAQLPTGITSANGAQPISVTSPDNIVHGGTAASLAGGGAVAGPSAPGLFSPVTSTGNNAISVTSNNTGGQPHRTVQPTLIVNACLFAGA